MKKCLMVLSVCVLLSGCNEKSLKCEYEGNYYDDMHVVDNYKIKFDGDKIKNVDYEREIKLSGELVKDIELFKTSYTFDFEMNQSENLKIDSKTKKETIYIDVDANYDKLSEEEKQAFKELDSKSNYEKTKKSLEELGFTCK